MKVEMEEWEELHKGIDDVLAAGEGTAVVPYVPTATNGKPTETVQHIPPRSIRSLMAEHTQLREPIIHGLLRRGETMNVIAPPKLGKSWFVNQLAIYGATGGYWHGHLVERGNVLIIDNELHSETSANRIPKVAAAMGVLDGDYADRLFVENLRGKLMTLAGLHSYFKQFKPGDFNIVILDAWYRFMPDGHDENGNSATMYNLLDNYARELNCVFVCVHHTTKGNQSGKAVTDVGSGGGVQSRAVDCHLVMRPHSQLGVVVVDAAVRSWAPIEPFCLRWNFPKWERDDNLDPMQLKDAKPSKQAGERPNKFESQRQKILAELASGVKTKTRLKNMLVTNGTIINDLLESLIEDGLIVETQAKTKGGKASQYELNKPETAT
jgi:AAA domain